MRISLIIGLAFLVFGCNTLPQEEESNTSNEWAIGIFNYSQDPFGEFLVKRTDSNQIEYITGNELAVEFGIEWLNDSTYNLNYIKTINNPDSISLPEDIDALVKTCVITKETDSSYVEKATSNLNSQTNYTTIYR
jgi:hypothetical protein